MDVDLSESNIEHGISDNSNVPIRALYVEYKCDFGFAYQYWRGLQEYFEKFGEIECGRIITDSSCAEWLIRYKNADSAKNALSMYKHDVTRYFPIKLQAADLWHQPDYRAEVPDQESETNILNALNDDCLYAVFRHLGFLDLAYVAEVCVRFKQLATATYSTVFKGRIKFGREFSERYEDVDIVLRNFGAKIEALDMDELHRGKDVLDIINQHCTSAISSLKELRMTKIDFCTGDEKFCPLFAKLQKLEMTNCDVFGCDSLMAACSELKQLTIIDNQSFNTNHSFPKLEKFSISVSSWSDTKFNHFVSLNPTLKKVFTASNVYLYAENVIRAICENLTQLVELEIVERVRDRNEFDREMLKLERLRFLKVLRLRFCRASIGSSMGAIVKNELPITKFIVDGGKINNEAVQSISQMKQITSLGFEWTDDLSDEHLITLVKELPQLQELHLSYFTLHRKFSFNCIKTMLCDATNLRILELESVKGITINFDDYEAIVKNIQNRPVKATLLIKVDESLWRDIIVNIPKETLLENYKILCIEKHF